MPNLQNHDLDIQVSLEGGCLTKATFQGKPFLYPSPVACFPMVPFGNRVADNQFHFQGQRYKFTANTAADPLYLHGDGWQAKWSLVHQNDSSLTIIYEQPASSQTPYRYRSEQIISIDRNRLSLHLSVENKGEFALPFGLGFHPFFLRTPKTQLSASAQTYWSERAGHLPDKSQPIPNELDFTKLNQLPDRWINNAFAGWNGVAQIVWPELRTKATLSADPQFPCYMLYAPEHEADFFCFEPMSHLPNGHNMPDVGGMKILEPGQQMAGGIQIVIDEIKD